MKFVEFTEWNTKRSIAIDIERICHIQKLQQGTLLGSEHDVNNSFGGYFVVESYEEVRQRIVEALI